MKTHRLKYNLLLLLAAAIWGFAFVAQRIGAQHVGTFTFNGIRFGLGSLSLLPLLLFLRNKPETAATIDSSTKRALPAGMLTGCVIFLGATLQQIGLVDTSAGKAAFITGLYIVLVPILGILLKHRIYANTWFGVAVAAIGLYFLCVTESFTIASGDLFELAGALFWTVHILLIDHFTKKVDALKLSFFQFVTCSLLSLAAALLFEDISLYNIGQAVIPLLYGGICSVGIAYTLQVIGQKHAQPSHAAIILSMESVFASVGGWLILKEDLGVRGYLGCLLMLFGMLLSQLQEFGKSKVPASVKDLPVNKA